MIANQELLDEARLHLSDIGETQRNRLQSAMDAYEVACRLSIGHDSDRASYWETRAYDARHDLVTAMHRAGIETVGVYEKVSSGHSLASTEAK